MSNDNTPDNPTDNKDPHGVIVGDEKRIAGTGARIGTGTYEAIDTELASSGIDKLNAMNERASDKRLSDETRLALTVARVAKAIGSVPTHILFAAIATLGGQAVFASAPTLNDAGFNRRRHNLKQFMNGVESSMAMMESTAANHEAKRAEAQRSDVIRLPVGRGKKPKLIIPN